MLLIRNHNSWSLLQCSWGEWRIFAR